MRRARWQRSMHRLRPIFRRSWRSAEPCWSPTPTRGAAIATRALAALATLDSAAADEARATILERANDWPAAQRALTDYAAKTVPAEGKLDDAQRRTLLRLATAAARAGDNAALTALRQREGARMGSGPLADMFRLLTADQVRSVADLKRSGQETALARELPGQLKALQASARQTP